MSKVIDAARVLRNHLSQTVADAVKDGDMGKARALVDAPAWRFLGLIIGDLDRSDDPATPDAPRPLAAPGQSTRDTQET